MMAHTNYDLVVIGGGPAGLMAAGQAALGGLRVLLLEKMDYPGRKLSITGMGRCNLTNTAEIEEFIQHFGKQRQFLRQAFARFFNQDLMVFMELIGILTVTERGGRVFPVEGDAKKVAEQLTSWTEGCGVDMRCESAVEHILEEEGQVVGVVTRTGAHLQSRTVVLATGGASYTGTGSTGDGFRMAAELGHTIQLLRPALVPIKTRSDTASRLQGLALRNVGVSVYIDGRRSEHAFGELMFTHFGLSGPVILTMSGRLVDALLKGGQVVVSIDLKPALNADKLDARLLRELDAHGRHQFGTMLKTLLPLKMIPVCANLTGIPEEKACHQITSAERRRLLDWIKDFRFEVSGHLPLEAAMITAGGVSLKELDPRTMASRLVKGLYLAGEVLDLAADTGGFNLQAAFSTGWLAGRSAAKNT